jgi:hypothetical protein
VRGEAGVAEGTHGAGSHFLAMRGRKIALLCFAALCCACDKRPATPVEYRPHEAGTLDHALCLLGYTGTPLRTAVTGHHFIDVELNGVSGVFVLDTGANLSVVDAASADTFGLEPSRFSTGQAFGIGGGQNTSIARIDSLEISGMDIRAQRIAIANIAHVGDVLGPLSGETIHGIIGQDVMTEHRAVIDVARPMLYLIEADAEPAPAPPERCAGQESQ